MALHRDSINVCQMKKQMESLGHSQIMAGPRHHLEDLGAECLPAKPGSGLLWIHSLHREATGRQMRSS